MIYGTVKDQDTGAPIDNVRVAYAGVERVGNDLGGYEIEADADSEIYDLSISKDGYLPEKYPIKATEGKTKKDIFLKSISGKCVICGHVFRQLYGSINAAPAANILVKSDEHSTVTDQDGFYILEVDGPDSVVEFAGTEYYRPAAKNFHWVEPGILREGCDIVLYYRTGQLITNATYQYEGVYNSINAKYDLDGS